MRQIFRQEEAEEILRAAMRRSMEREIAGTAPSAGISAERLQSMAAELGIDEATLQAILDERQRGERLEAERQNEAKLRELFIGARRHEFVPHAIAYCLCGALFVFLNAITTRFPWAVLPLLAWGIGFAIHAWQTVPTRGPAFEASFEEWRSKREKKPRRKKDD